MSEHLELDLPALPEWATNAINAIATLNPAAPDARSTLESLIAPIRARPECEAKASVRATMRHKESEIQAARAKSATIETTLATVVVESVAPVAPAVAERVEPVTRGNGEQLAHDSSGIQHTATGPNIFSLPPSERTVRVGESATSSDVRKLLNERDLIAGACADGSMLQWSWIGGGSTTVDKIRAGLVALGRENDTPGGPSAERHAGRAVDHVRNRDFDTTRLPTASLPNGVKARWCVGRKLSGRTISAGDAYGYALLIVDLREDGTLGFDGDPTLATVIRSHYTAATAREVLRSEDLTAWLGGLLKRRHGAVKRGANWYIPGGHADACRALFDLISKLWGDHEVMPVTTGKDLFRSLTRGLSDEIGVLEVERDRCHDAAVERAKAKAVKKASETHGATEAYIAAMEAEAAKRATISPTVAARLLTQLASVAARVAGYETLLGADSVAGAKGRIATMRTALEPLTDDTSARAAMLELE